MNLSDPYCGPAPLPADLWSRWVFDPVAALLIAVLFCGWLLIGRRDRVGHLALASALGLIAIAFFSPLCALTTALFSARVVHHVILISVIAPLLAIALPWRDGPLLPLAPLTILGALVVWIWHAPSAYEWAIYGTLPYWLMQVTLLGSSWFLWREVLSPLARAGGALIALTAFVGQMGLLGALLVFSPFPVYTPHLSTTAPYGLSALADQQLAGLLMWVPAMLPYLAVGLWLVLRLANGLPNTRRSGLAR
ncbi:cytochrome c oxidase assembly protein [Pelagibacterium sp. 26DY04]|uniref:cytochrome c oxidase assembly protein n=1 Tax=Pelagibacterium sp. 26DY04 TaxID=2967130 RepID=UPI002814AD81|nr:cytochrome c oxidase assembly protein [Pelagibacterium sp. 26DY04]WMT85453.1 cytochrome c oxidase assembly protein [Pelagibacterium sp. 26DY04]